MNVRPHLQMEAEQTLIRICEFIAFAIVEKPMPIASYQYAPEYGLKMIVLNMPEGSLQMILKETPRVS